jgi:hypothetical protein
MSHALGTLPGQHWRHCVSSLACHPVILSSCYHGYLSASGDNAFDFVAAGPNDGTFVYIFGSEPVQLSPLSSQVIATGDMDLDGLYVDTADTISH